MLEAVNIDLVMNEFGSFNKGHSYVIAVDGKALHSPTMHMTDYRS